MDFCIDFSNVRPVRAVRERGSALGQEKHYLSFLLNNKVCIKHVSELKFARVVADTMTVFRALLPLCVCSLASSRGATETRLVFMHINESGGSTWMKWMSEHQKMCRAATDGSLASSGCDISKNLCSLKGPGFQKSHWHGETALSMIIDMVRSNCTFVELHHWDVAAAQAFRAFGYEMATIIRDPVRRIASSFNYANERSNATAALIERFYSGVRTPDRTLGFLTGCYGCCSGLQHLRDGAPGYRSQDDASHSDCSIAPQQCAILRATAAATEALGVVAGQSAACTKNISTMLSVAFASLRAFDFVGVLEHMDKTVALFCAQYGVCFSPETIRIHANSHPKLLDVDRDKKAASVLREALRPDLAVYDLAVSLFDQKIALRRTGHAALSLHGAPGGYPDKAYRNPF